MGTLQIEQMEWHPIGQTPNQLILYHPPSHALSVRPHPINPTTPSTSSHAGPSSRPHQHQHQHQPLLLSYRSETPIETITRDTPLGPLCPYCSQALPPASIPTSGFSHSHSHFGEYTADNLTPVGVGDVDSDGGLDTNVSVNMNMTVSGDVGPRYFRILERAHEGSRPPSPGSVAGSRSGSDRRFRSATPTRPDDPPDPDDPDELDEDDLPARGYYERFFREEGRLGMGAEGSVYLATHVIGGSVLGTYAVKKIAVGRSKSYLVKMLREVRLLEALRHPNIIPYHHSWIDRTRFSSFGPTITALHVLMMYATAGNLDTFLLTRSHSTQPARPDLSAGDIADADSLDQLPREERIKAFKKRRQSSAGGAKRKREETRGVLLLGLEEVGKLFGDVVEGLAFLHANSILHLDLKCSNVLLHWEEGKLIPKALLSDFGTSEEMLKGSRERTGHTGTMEYMAPETLSIGSTGQWRPSDSHADMWSLGLILHKLLFLSLPYSETEDFAVLHQEILQYPGFVPTAELYASCERRHIPRDLLLLLSKLVHVNPEARPSAEKVKTALRGLELQARTTTRSSAGGLVARVARVSEGLGGLIRKSSSPSEASLPLPVPRHVLALPSPEDELRDPVAGRFPGKAFASWRSSSNVSYATGLRFLIAIIKVVSLQPHLSGFNFSPYLSLVLLATALLDVKFDRWNWTLSSSAVHVSILLGLSLSSSQDERAVVA